jgi:hypothetical protein
MLRGSRHLGKILGYSFSPIKFHLSLIGSLALLGCLALLGSLASRRAWSHLAATVRTEENRVYNKPNSCSATGALAPGTDHQPTTIEIFLTVVEQ